MAVSSVEAWETRATGLLRTSGQENGAWRATAARRGEVWGSQGLSPRGPGDFKGRVSGYHILTSRESSFS